MDREFLDEALSRLLGDDATCRPAGWSETEVKEYRRLVDAAWAAEITADLVNMRMLRIERHADDPARANAKLSSGRTIGLIFKSPEGPVSFELLPPERDNT